LAGGSERFFAFAQPFGPIFAAKDRKTAEDEDDDDEEEDWDMTLKGFGRSEPAVSSLLAS
jgi:hypothetical protein